MEANELRIGNWVRTVYPINKKPFQVWPIAFKQMPTDKEHNLILDTWEPIPLTEQWLLDFGFYAVETDMYINGKQLLLQVDELPNEDGSINEDGTWFDGIGKFNFKETGQVAVNTLCRGNYVCKTVDTVHGLQNLYFALTGKELKLKQ